MELEHFAVGRLLLLGAVVIATLIFLAVIAGYLRSPRAEAERARLFEMGYYLPRRPSRWPQTLFCMALGLGVPVVALSFASAGESTPWVNVWVIACIISVAGIVGATIVAAIVFFRPEPSGHPEPLVPTNAKPAVNPDALDFAGRMGHG
jgi:hypothetical protein